MPSCGQHQNCEVEIESWDQGTGAPTRIKTKTWTS